LNLVRHLVKGSGQLSRFSIGPRLAACFIFLIFLMLSGNGLLLWEFHLVRAQFDKLAEVDQELVAVLRFQDSLRAFYDRLNELAQSKDRTRLDAESETLRASLLGEAQRTEAVFNRLPPEDRLNPTVLASLEAVQSELPSHLDAIKELASSGDWAALRFRLQNQVRPLESVGSELVLSVDKEVAAERAQAALNIHRAENRMFLIFLATGLLTLLIAAFLGLAITQSITEPLGDLMKGSQALARGEFQRQIPVKGKDELAQLAVVFNDTARRLQNLYETLRNREEKLQESQKEMRRLIEFVPAHVFVLACDGSGLYANRRVLDYHGLSLEEWMADQYQCKIVYSEDVERYVAVLRKGLSKCETFETEARLRQKDGKYRWFLSRFDPVQDEEGNILRWYVARTDIEENKRESERARNENLALREEVNRSGLLDEVLGSSEKLVRVLSEVARVAPTDSTVLILGETGTGKELVARAIHRQSNRAACAFIRVNCAAIPSSLVSSELFGHEKGAFTGAIQRRLGRFEAAGGGTIFLDEIGDLPAETQVTLLRVLQEREFERVGSNVPISVDVRILAATNRDLKAAVSAGNFRQDLFYRLNVFPIVLPPLRERTGDIPLLLEYFIERYAKKVGKSIRRIRRNTLELFESYDWPGNIRELQNVVERAVLLCDSDSLSVDAAWLKQQARLSTQSSVEPLSLGRLDPSREREIIEAALSESSGRISGPSGAAAKLGIPRQTLESKMARLGINKTRQPNS